MIDALGALLMPGRINAHTHIAMSLFRGLAEDRSLQDWLQKFIFPAEARNVTPEFATKLSVLEMIRSGTTPQPTCTTIIGFPAPDNKTSEAGFAYTERFLSRWKRVC